MYRLIASAFHCLHIFLASLNSKQNLSYHSNWILSSLGAFEDDNVIHVEGDVNPVRDIEIINEELRLKDEEQLLASVDKLGKTVLRGDKKDKVEYVSPLPLKFWTNNWIINTFRIFCVKSNNY